MDVGYVVYKECSCEWQVAKFSGIGIRIPVSLRSKFRQHDPIFFHYSYSYSHSSLLQFRYRRMNSKVNVVCVREGIQSMISSEPTEGINVPQGNDAEISEIYDSVFAAHHALSVPHHYTPSLLTTAVIWPYQVPQLHYTQRCTFPVSTCHINSR
jgi:hypothetical protein